MLVLLTAAILSATPVASSPPPQPMVAPMAVALAETPDAARLAAARAVVDLAYPPATRRAMFAGVEAAMTPLMQRAIEQNPDLRQHFSDDPRVKPIFDRYMARVRATMMATVDASIPALFDAYGRAYARRFTLAQLGDLKAFFATPTGQLYTSRALSLLSDPDVAVANQAMIAGGMKNVRGDAQAMVAEIKALPPVPGK